MLQSWRWFGPDDPVSLSNIRQAGASGIVTALHHLPNGSVWPRTEITARKAMIEAAGLDWVVVESIPVHEDIKTGAAGWERYADAWAESAENLAAEGITTICYNFMPVLDWTRTHLAWRLPDGSEALRFVQDDYAAFDLFILRRPGAEGDHDAAAQARACERFDAMSPEQRESLTNTILAGLPGTEESYTLASFRDRLTAYQNITAEALRNQLAAFLRRVLPRIEAAGARLALHPDDPPRPLFGLPRVVSTASDLRAVLAMSDSPGNGLTFCTGSLGVSPDNDLPAMLAEFGERIYFLHLRATQREDEPGSFHESDHLSGDVPMAQIVGVAMDIEAARGSPIPMRPDHGHAMLSDLSAAYRPGYPAIGRLRGLAELRGVEHGLRWAKFEQSHKFGKN